jgi:hypothetical protein
MKLHLLVAIFALSAATFSLGEGWEVLFDGKSLDQWTNQKGEPVTKGWEVKDGAIHRYEKRRGDQQQEAVREFRARVRVEDLGGRQQRGEVPLQEGARAGIPGARR